MKKLIAITLVILLSTASGLGSEAVFRYKAQLTVQKVESSTLAASLLSDYLIQYRGMKIYNPVKSPATFDKIIGTISTIKRVCFQESFEYNLFINKTWWDYFQIKDAIKLGMKAQGYKAIKVNEFGVTMWENSKRQYAVNFMTKLTPFTYLNSTCKVQ